MTSYTRYLLTALHLLLMPLKVAATAVAAALLPLYIQRAASLSSLDDVYSFAELGVALVGSNAHTCLVL
jgi:hypothetical protein